MNSLKNLSFTQIAILVVGGLLLNKILKSKVAIVAKNGNISNSDSLGVALQSLDLLQNDLNSDVDQTYLNTGVVPLVYPFNAEITNQKMSFTNDYFN